MEIIMKKITLILVMALSLLANNIKEIVTKKGLNVFALMQQDMTVGLDLPLRILVFKDTDGKVKMAYRDGSWLASKHILDAPKKEKKINKAMAMFVQKRDNV
jgi:hypothetical protein